MHLYDIARRSQVRQADNLGAARAITFSHDGRYIATGSTEKSAAVFDASTAKEMARWDCGGDVRAVAFSLDDKYVLCAAELPTKNAVAVVHRVLWRTLDLLEAACAGVGRNFYNWEGQRYFGDTPYPRTCTTLPDPNITKAIPPTPPVPAMIDWSSQMLPARDQGSEGGSVVGFSVGAVMEFLIRQQLHQEVRLSPRYIYYLYNGGSEDFGANIKDTLTALKKTGAVTDSVWPYKGGEFNAKPPPQVHYRTTCETLKKEIHFFHAGVDEYEDSQNRQRLFVKRVEALISRENTLWLTTIEQKDDKTKS